MLKLMNLISLKKIYIYTNIIILYFVYILLNSNWSDNFTKKPSCRETKDNLSGNEFVDLENNQDDITKVYIPTQSIYNIQFDKQLEITIKFILILFMFMIAIIVNNALIRI